jgi:hypothetical protein
MNKEWLCVNCLRETELDIHGRCRNCGSDAVDMIERRFPLADGQSAPFPPPSLSAPTV